MRFRLESEIKRAARKALDKAHFALPARVVSYDPERQSAKVRPSVARRRYNRETGEVSYDDPPIIAGVPVQHPVAEAGGLTIPVKAGDRVQLIFNEAALDEWYFGDDEITRPFDARRNDYTDAVAIVGLRPPGNPLPAEYWHEDHPVIFGEEVLLGDSTASTALALAQNLALVLNDLIARFNRHNHVSAAPGTPGGPPIVPLSPVSAGDFSSEVAMTNDPSGGLSFPDLPPIPPTPEPSEEEE